MLDYYKKYFNDLATLSADILHTEESKSFFYVDDKYSIEAFDNAIKSAAKTPALLLEQYTSDLDDNTNEIHFEHLSGRFTILLKAIVGDSASKELARTTAEGIAQKFLFRMRKDLKDGGIIVLPNLSQRKAFFKIQKVSIDPVGPINVNYYGVTVGFIWRCPLLAAVSNLDWTDI